MSRIIEKFVMLFIFRTNAKRFVMIDMRANDRTCIYANYYLGTFVFNVSI